MSAIQERLSDNVLAFHDLNTVWEKLYMMRVTAVVALTEILKPFSLSHITSESQLTLTDMIKLIGYVHTASFPAETCLFAHPQVSDCEMVLGI